ncbi:MAG: spore coat associated protein CotJA [Lachnospiraceae bacterium]|nr:spore coat associated protein CotJA [Lachnospiraceae bacterium]
MKETDFFKNKTEFPVGMAYVPWQNMEQVYENLEEAFAIGTLFPELTKPFEGRRRK